MVKIYHANELLESLTVDGLANSLMAATLEGSGVAPYLVIWWSRKTISCQPTGIWPSDDAVLLLEAL